MKFVFDTDHISYLQHPASREAVAIARRVAAHRRTDFAYSTVSFHEQCSGAHNAVQRARRVADLVVAYSLFDKILHDFSKVMVVSFDAAAAADFDRLRAIPVRIGTNDLRIAAVALANNLTLLTRNAKDFAKVPGLRFEDWTT